MPFHPLSHATAQTPRIACYGLRMCQQSRVPSLVHSPAARRPGIELGTMQVVASRLQNVFRRPAGDLGRLCTLQIELPQAHKGMAASCQSHEPRSMRLREGRTRLTVLLYCYTRAKGKDNVTGFGAFSISHKRARPVALIGWKANRQAFACVEAVGTDEELNCCLKRLTA